MARERGAANDNYRGLPGPVASIGKAVLLLPRRVRASRRRLPDFLIIGAQRAGTTSLYRYLVEHPDVEGASPSKGVHYFDEHPEKSLGWYRAHFPISRGAGPITGEGAPYYLFHPLVPGRVAASLPDVRVIALLRDPVERAYSQYKQEYARGFEDSATFERALDLEEERLDGEEARIVAQPGYASFHHQHHSYVARGRYAEQLDRWYEAIGPDRVLALQTERFSADPQQGMTQVFEFLGLEPVHQAAYKRHNARPYADMLPETRERLARQFAEPNRMLYALLGSDFGWTQPQEAPR